VGGGAALCTLLPPPHSCTTYYITYLHHPPIRPAVIRASSTSVLFHDVILSEGGLRSG
jgi:hypothetical protein